MRYPVSDHCDGERFFNVHGPEPRGPGDLLKWWRTREARPWPASVPVARAPLPPRQAPDGHIAATFIGHSTFLIQAGRSAILTDPVFTSHAGPLGRFGPRRVRRPAHAIADLPAVDVVVVSHNHYDHMQPGSLREIDARFHPAFVTTLGNASFLRRIGLQRVAELDWWSHQQVGDVAITCTPAQHFSARGVGDRNRTLWGGFGLNVAGKTICFTGDTGYCGHFVEIGARLRTIDLALIPIGAYQPRWFMAPVHVNPEEAVRIHLDLQTRVSVAMHFGTFKLTDEGLDDPVTQLVAAKRTAGVEPEAFRVPAFGETLIV
jgi:L-ascorbate metabolism protein UlaG (beta-lactamase superfamily)